MYFNPRVFCTNSNSLRFAVVASNILVFFRNLNHYSVNKDAVKSWANMVPCTNWLTLVALTNTHTWHARTHAEHDQVILEISSFFLFAKSYATLQILR